MSKTTIRRVGRSFVITLPKTIVENYHLNEGDEVYLIPTGEGIVVTPLSPKFREWVKAYERTNKRFRNTLNALAN